MLWEPISNTRKSVSSDIQDFAASSENSATPKFFNSPLRHGLNISSCLICYIHILGTGHENLDDVSDSRSWRSCSVFDYWFLTNVQHASLIRLVPVGIQSSLQVTLAILFSQNFHSLYTDLFLCMLGFFYSPIGPVLRRPLKHITISGLPTVLWNWVESCHQADKSLSDG